MTSVSVSSRHTRSGGTPALTHARQHLMDVPGLSELAGRDVHADHQLVARRLRGGRARPTGQVLERLSEHQRSQPDVERSLLGERDERAGEDDPSGGIREPGERLERHRGTGGQVDQRLVVHDDRVPVEALVDQGQPRLAGLRSHPMAVLVDGDRFRPPSLAAATRALGVLDHLTGGRVTGADRHAHAAGHEDVATTHRHADADIGQQPLAEPSSSRRHRPPARRRRSRRRPGAPRCRRSPTARFRRSVTCSSTASPASWSSSSFTPLKRSRSSIATPRARPVGPFGAVTDQVEEPPAVGQPRERVGPALALRLGLRLAGRREVADHRDHAVDRAVGQALGTEPGGEPPATAMVVHLPGVIEPGAVGGHRAPDGGPVAAKRRDHPIGPAGGGQPRRVVGEAHVAGRREAHREARHAVEHRAVAVLALEQVGVGHLLGVGDRRDVEASERRRQHHGLQLRQLGRGTEHTGGRDRTATR